MEIDTITRCHAILQQILQKVQSLNKDLPKLLEVLKTINDHLPTHSLGLIVAIFHKGHLKRILECAQEIYLKEKDQNIIELLRPMYSLSYDCFLKEHDQTRKVLNKLPIKNKQYKEQVKKNEDELSKDLKQIKQIQKTFIELYTQFYGISKSKEQSFLKGKKLLKFISERLQKKMIEYKKDFKSLSIFDQVAITFLRKQVSDFHKHILQTQKMQPRICCNLHFSDDPKDSYSDDFKQAYFIPNLEYSNTGNQNKFKDQQNIKRYAIYYLNNNGGILYAGLQSTKAKNYKVKGIFFKDDTYYRILVNELLKVFVGQIFPFDHEDINKSDQEQDDEIKNYILKKYKDLINQISRFLLSLELSNYFSIEFLNVYDQNTLFFKRNQTKQLLYVLKINVKAGNPAQVYFSVNQKDQPEAYVTSQEKAQTMIEFYDLIYQKLKEKANGKLTTPDASLHSLCKTSLKYTTDGKK